MEPSTEKRKVTVIAEAGVNHNGSKRLAMEMIEVAAEAGVDVVKFQTFCAEKVISRFAPKAEYQIKTTGSVESQLEMAKKLELSESSQRRLFEYCGEKGIDFLSTPFDLDAVDFLVDLGVSRLKIASGEITNGPLLLKGAGTGLPIILSTGMSSLGEVETALGVLAYGYMRCEDKPSLKAFRKCFASEYGQKLLKEKVWMLHCTTEYPAPFDSVNLKAMDTLATIFGLVVGYSDHTPGITVPIVAVARGAMVIEKHFTLDRTLPGPDQKASIAPHELKAMVEAIRQTELSLGTSVKEAAPAEEKNKQIARRSLVAARMIKDGKILTEEDIAVKRPGNGRSPMEYWQILGKAAERNYDRDEALE